MAFVSNRDKMWFFQNEYPENIHSTASLNAKESNGKLYFIKVDTAVKIFIWVLP